LESDFNQLKVDELKENCKTENCKIEIKII
jgi:hypothetical protein